MFGDSAGFCRQSVCVARICLYDVAYFPVCIVNGSAYNVSCRLNFSVTILQANVSFHIFRSMYHVTAVGKLKVKTVICFCSIQRPAQ